MKWISTKDKLPKISYKTMSNWVLTYDSFRVRIDKAFFSNVTGWQAEHGEDMSVTHWMPLPPKPKE